MKDLRQSLSGPPGQKPLRPTRFPAIVAPAQLMSREQIRVEVRAANKIAWLPGTGATPRPFQTVSN
jgi:hypothetical protein